METRNLVLAIVLSAAILIAFQYLAPQPKHVPPPSATLTETSTTTPEAGATAPAESQIMSRDEALRRSPRIAISTPKLTGSIALKGARIDDLTLTTYREKVDPSSPAVVLLSPSGTAHAYFAEQSWLATQGNPRLPDDQSEWTSDRDKLTIEQPVTLTWDNGEGLVFTRTIALDGDYMFTVKESVRNDGTAPLALRPYALVTRGGPTPPSPGWWTISYEGPIGAFDGIEEDVKYTAIGTDAPVKRKSTGGWAGFSDKYWLTAIAPAEQSAPIEARFLHAGAGDTQRFQVDYLGTETTVAPGATASATTLVFAGAKEVRLLAHYRDALGLARFDNAVDFGWFYFLTKPIFYLLDTLYAATGNFGVAILILTVIMRILFFPLQTRAVISMNKMKALQPEIVKLRELHGDDKVKLNQETMELYKRKGVNPLGGCLPVLLQIPIFFSLYKVLYVTIEMRQAPFYGWIHDLSAADPTSIWNLFGLIPWQPFAFLPPLGVWPILYCGSMFLQQRMNPPPPDPVQARMMQFMPLMLMFMLGQVASGLVIYWTFSNVLILVQQYVITRHVAVDKPAKA
jgi:YidC/Oxa1 family membrane protein insertase